MFMVAVRSLPFWCLIMISVLADQVALGSQALAELTVKKLTWAGSGCPATIESSSKVGQNGSLVLSLPELEVTPALPGASLRSMRKNCLASLILDYPKDKEFRIVKATVSIASKGRSLDGLIRIDQRFQGESTALFQDFEIKGEKPLVKTEIKLGQTSWSKCGIRKPLMFQLAARINKIPPEAEAKDTSILLQGPVELQIVWRECKVKSH